MVKFCNSGRARRGRHAHRQIWLSIGLVAMARQAGRAVLESIGSPLLLSLNWHRPPVQQPIRHGLICRAIQDSILLDRVAPLDARLAVFVAGAFPVPLVGLVAFFSPLVGSLGDRSG